MKNYLDKEIMLGIDEGEGTEVSTATLESQLVALEDRLAELTANDGDQSVEIALVKLQMARTKLGLDDNAQAWQLARSIFDELIEKQQWELAVDACDVMFLSAEDQALVALGHAIWLAVTYPIDPELSIAVLQHVVDETPDDADGAAVAAATAVYLAELRCQGKQKDNLLFFANQMLGAVARRHSQVESNEQFEFWIEKLELNDPSKFLVRLRNVVDVLVQENWWIDREALQQALPVN